MATDAIIEELQTQNFENSCVISNLKKEKASLQEQCNGLKNELARVNRKLERFKEADCESCKLSTRTHLMITSEKDSIIRELKSDIKNLRREKEDELNDLKISYGKVCRELDTVKNDLKAAYDITLNQRQSEQDKTIEISRLEDRLKTLENQLQSQNTIINQQKQEIAELSSSNKSLYLVSDENRTLRITVQNQENLIANQRNELANAAATMTELVESTEKRVASFDKLKQENAKLALDLKSIVTEGNTMKWFVQEVAKSCEWNNTDRSLKLADQLADLLKHLQNKLDLFKKLGKTVINKVRSNNSRGPEINSPKTVPETPAPEQTLDEPVIAKKAGNNLQKAILINEKSIKIVLERVVEPMQAKPVSKCINGKRKQKTKQLNCKKGKVKTGGENQISSEHEDDKSKTGDPILASNPPNKSAPLQSSKQPVIQDCEIPDSTSSTDDLTTNQPKDSKQSDGIAAAPTKIEQVDSEDEFVDIESF